jgi:hypothetical protein
MLASLAGARRRHAAGSSSPCQRRPGPGEPPPADPADPGDPCGVIWCPRREPRSRQASRMNGNQPAQALDATGRPTKVQRRHPTAGRRSGARNEPQFPQEQQLRRVETGVRWSDPDLAVMFCVFGRLYAEPSQHHTGLQPRRALARAHTHRLMAGHHVEVEARSESSSSPGQPPAGAPPWPRRLLRDKYVTATRRDPQPQRYQVCVRGRLSKTIRCAFPDLQARTRGRRHHPDRCARRPGGAVGRTG